MTVPRGHGLTVEVLRLAGPPTAVFAASDLGALGAMAAVREAGLTFPRDVSVIVHDDTWVADRAVPPLTVIRQPMPETAARRFAPSSPRSTAAGAAR